MSAQPRSATASKSAALQSFEAQWLAREADSLSALRERAMERFVRLGLPTTRDESWRYTNLKALAAPQLRRCAARAAPAIWRSSRCALWASRSAPPRC